MMKRIRTTRSRAKGRRIPVDNPNHRHGPQFNARHSLTKPVLGLTMGDPAGIGPEICLRAIGEPSVLQRCVPVLFGDAIVLRRVAASVKAQGGAAASGMRMNDRFPKTLSLAEFEKSSCVSEPSIVDCAAIGVASIRPGAISAACGKAAFVFIERAIQSALRGRIDGVVTAPIHKEALRLAGVPYPGHTEIFTTLTGARRSCMMLRSGVLTVSMATTHIGYADVPKELSVKRLLDVIELTAVAMKQFLHRAPRLGICGLNPHAGEHGLFGQREEERLVEPALDRARARGIPVEGPLPPDAAFTANQRKRFDAFVALYHDQGHIPFKMLAFETGVNITLGLPIIRTSVDHGTAFDIAWKGVADPRSLFAAIRAASELALARFRGGVAP